MVAGRVIQSIGAQIDGDHVFRVDLDLRPGGKDSELVISFDSAVDYYQTEARTWERLALLKARPVAGNITLGKTFIKEIQPVHLQKIHRLFRSGRNPLHERKDHGRNPFPPAEG